jgi:hypothetical protein
VARISDAASADPSASADSSSIDEDASNIAIETILDFYSWKCGGRCMVAVFEDMPLPARGIGKALQRNLDYCHLSYDLYAQLPPVIKSRTLGRGTAGKRDTSLVCFGIHASRPGLERQ